MTIMLSSDEACREAGLTYRQLDYLIRCEAVRPTVDARGSGSQRRFSLDDVCVLRVLMSLRCYGASTDVLRRVAADLTADPSWFAFQVVVDRAGRLYPMPVDGCGWLLDLPSIRATVRSHDLVAA